MKIVCIHGFGGISLGFKDIIKHLKQKGPVDVIFFNYPEKFGTISLMDLAKRLVKVIEQEKPDALICLSQGGIIGALALEEFGGKEYCQKCITICTPFKGTTIATKVDVIGAVELRPNSKLLNDLDLKIKNSDVKYYSVWNPLDFTVHPGISGKCEHARKTLEVKSLLHNTTWHDKRTCEFVAECLAE